MKIHNINHGRIARLFIVESFMNKLRLFLVISLLLFSVKDYSQSLVEYPFTKMIFSTTKQHNNAKMYVTGAFTSYLGGIVGDYAVNGVYHKGKEPNKNKTLGVICIHDREVDIYPAGCNVRSDNYFHQICLVRGRKSQIVKSEGDYRTLRRAIGMKTDGQKYLVECENITLHNFSILLQKNYYVNAIYVDCGNWDYGWIKENGKIKRLGHSDTDENFTNYLYFW